MSRWNIHSSHVNSKCFNTSGNFEHLMFRFLSTFVILRYYQFYLSISESPVRTNEFMENSCNWDLEYNSISLNSRQIRRNLFEEKKHSTATEYMDISNLATPKTKSFNLSQRKKLSSSFKFDDSLSEEDVVETEEKRHSKRLNFCDNYDVGETDSTDFVLSQNTHDTGYNTETSHKLNYSKDEDMVISYVSENSADTSKENRNPNIFASTPSKRYFSLLE